jgi:electron transfer flavoprotein beta subunit
MKVLVAVKRVLDHAVRPRVGAGGTGVDLSNAKLAMNPFDEIAVEEALRLRERDVVTRVVAITCGPAAAQDVLRAALAMGADEALHVQTDMDLAPLTVAKLLKAAADREQPDLMLLGKQAIDDDCNQTGQMLAALADVGQATNASRVELGKDFVEVTREVDGGLETVRLGLPAVVTTDLRLNEPRYVTLPNIMKAKKKPLRVLTAAELGVDTTQRVRTLRVAEPPRRRAGVRVPDVATLVKKLREEARVI